MKNIKTSWIVLGVIGLICIMAWTNYNGMVTGEENTLSQWSNVENVYQRRSDLIPNLVNTVKGYAAHEKETLTGVIEARSKATGININANNLNAETIKKFQAAQGGLTSALSKLMVVVERYPDLKANQNFLELQAQLEGTENRIAVERRKFNNVAKIYNQKIKKLPGKLFNALFGFEPKPYFEAEKGTEKAPEVKF